MAPKSWAEVPLEEPTMLCQTPGQGKSEIGEGKGTKEEGLRQSFRGCVPLSTVVAASRDI